MAWGAIMDELLKSWNISESTSKRRGFIEVLVNSIHIVLIWIWRALLVTYVVVCTYIKLKCWWDDLWLWPVLDSWAESIQKLKVKLTLKACVGWLKRIHYKLLLHNTIDILSPFTIIEKLLKIIQKL